MTAPLRVVVTGSECTGKTSLARFLARRYDAPWVPEFSRAYAEAKAGALTADDVEPIARGTLDAEARLTTPAGGLLILDTDLVSTVVYARHYYGACPGWIEREAAARRADLHLLCHVDVPWEDDEIRDRPHLREQLHALFHQQLVRLGAPIVHVFGTFAERERRAAAAVDALRRDRARA